MPNSVMLNFESFPKMARLSREMVITEKIDGTNASILITDDGDMLVGSRTRWITPEDDNFGFARWAYAHKDELMRLGPGHHFGEWWGSGIQRKYGLVNGEKRFSLFAVHRWTDDAARPSCCHVVPTLYTGVFDTNTISTQIERLRTLGSVAAPGFMQPEGIVIYHTAAKTLFKKTLDKDDMPKGLAG